MTSTWDEFGLIASCFRPLSRTESGAFDLTDDAAVLTPSAGCDWVVTADALVGGVHFFPDDPPASIARKAMRVNLSDLAAMGAKPRCVFLTCALPVDLSREWLESFASGLGEDLHLFDVALAGGDVVATPGPLTLSITAMGEAPAGRVLRRNGVRPGDVVAVTGSIGDAALGLDLQRETAPANLSDTDRAFLLDRYRHPRPRIAAGQFLNGAPDDVRANAAMDVSDGLFADVRHLAETSGVDIVLDTSRVPLSDAAHHWVAASPEKMARVLSGGDDYELVFTCAPEAFMPLAERLAGISLSVTAIGRAEAGQGDVYRLDGEQRRRVDEPGGHRHGAGVTRP